MAQTRNTRSVEVLGHNPVIAQILKKVERVAKTDVTVLVLGETGVGKGLIARRIHSLSPRRTKAFISVDCGVLPNNLVESELFGHEKGAFTGAVARRIGYFERAHGGTLFLDEIGNLPVDSQQVLLHVLEQDSLTRVGGRGPIPIDVRTVAATNTDLKRAVREGTFREDLYFRLNKFPLMLPPLRARREDIPLLVARFVRQYVQELQRSVPTLSAEVLAYLQEYAWPGNVRELEQWVQRALIMCEGEHIELADVLADELTDGLAAEDVGLAASPVATLPVAQEAEGGGEKRRIARGVDEKQLIVEALWLANWVVGGNRGAARLLEMSDQTLRYRMHKHGIQQPEERLGPEDWERLLDERKVMHRKLYK